MDSVGASVSDDYSKNPWGNYPSNKAYEAGDRLLKYLNWKKVLDLSKCDITDFIVDYEALSIEWMLRLSIVKSAFV